MLGILHCAKTEILTETSLHGHWASLGMKKAFRGLIYLPKLSSLDLHQDHDAKGPVGRLGFRSCDG